MLKSLWSAALAALILAGTAVAQEEWTIDIRPAETVAPAPVEGKLTYEQAYAMVPYRKSEYQANPHYRHEAAMEIMFGAMRPTTIVRPTYGPKPSHYYYPRRYIYNARSLWHPPYSLFAKDLY